MKTDIKPCVFLDRDGVINMMPDYDNPPPEGRIFDSPRSVADFQFIPGAAEAIVLLSKHFRVLIVTNQPGVAYGKIPTLMVIDDINRHMVAEIRKLGGRIDGIQSCPYSHRHERMAGGKNNPWYHENHPDRKPNPGMFFNHAATQEAKGLPIDFSSAWMVGDRASDLEAGQNAGIPDRGLVLIQAPYHLDESYESCSVFPNLAAVAGYILASLPK